MVLSLLLGFAIGFERKLRFKEAGIRTHTIVCVGACLFTLVSVFGFSSADSSRVAAQVVSGIGFIGAGMIFYHKEVVRGLTTAAGIWATAAIGMSVGAGLSTLN
ncbi:MAG: MgtC/SapB family protein [Clostridiales bacterium]|nr:MgtC/SapB family protein [Clostridiales bacterium]